MGKIRNFTKDTVKEVWTIVRDVEENSDMVFFDFMQDMWNNIWDNDPTMDTYLEDANKYYTQMVDNHDINSLKFRRILGRVKYVDMDYHNRFTEIGVVQSEFTKKIINKAALITPQAICMQNDDYMSMIECIDSIYEINKEVAFDSIQSMEDTMIDLEDPAWYISLKDRALGTVVSVLKGHIDGALMPALLTYKLIDGIFDTDYSECIKELGTIFEEDYIIDNLVTDKEAYYEGRVVGDGLCMVLGVAELMTGAVLTVGGMGGGFALAPASFGISVVAGAGVAAEGLALGALGVGVIYSSYNDMDDSKAKMADAHDEFNNIKKNELKGADGADANNVLNGVSKGGNGSSITIGKEDLDILRNKLGVPDTETVAVGKTNVKGLEKLTFEGESPIVRKEAGLPDLDEIWENRNIKYPGNNPLFSRHAEEGVVNQFDKAVMDAGIDPSDVTGVLKIHQSNPTGVCRKCYQGLANNKVKPGILKQLSLKYPNLRIEVTSEIVPGVEVTGRSELIIQNGQYVY